MGCYSHPKSQFTATLSVEFSARDTEKNAHEKESSFAQHNIYIYIISNVYCTIDCCFSQSHSGSQSNIVTGKIISYDLICKLYVALFDLILCFWILRYVHIKNPIVPFYSVVRCLYSQPTVRLESVHRRSQSLRVGGGLYVIHTYP